MLARRPRLLAGLMPPIKAALIGLALMALPGCASIAEGTIDASRPVLLTSTPSNARVTQGGRVICSTPCTARQGQLRYGEAFTFTFPDAGVMTVDPQMTVNGNVLGNVIFGGGVGALIDIASGRMVVNGRHVHADQTATGSLSEPSDLRQ